MDPVRYFSALVLVGGLLALAIWLLKHLRLGTRNGESATLNIISHTSLGTREKLVVIRFDDKKLLLGVTPGSITRLATSRADSSSDSPDEPSRKRL